MTQYRLIPTGGTIKFADTEVAVDTAPDFMCQVTSCSIDPVPAYNTNAATGCTGETQTLKTPVPWVMTITFMQDWTAPGGGLANYAKTNAGKIVFYEYVPTDDATLGSTGQVELVPVKFGGDMGVVAMAGPVNWSVQGEPTFTTPVVAAADTANVYADAE